MKNNFFNANLPKFAALAAGAFLLYSAPLASAENSTNAEVKPPKHSLKLKFDIGSENSGATNFYGLPPEALSRLSPEQIMELAKLNEPPGILIVMVPLAMFAMIVACVALGVSQRSKRARLLHETLRLMIEKGQPIPPELLQSPDGRRPRNDLRNGLVLLAIGLGLGILFLSEKDDSWPIALIPLLIGAAFMTTWKIEASKNGQPK